jgi:hypothetical protein
MIQLPQSHKRKMAGAQKLILALFEEYRRTKKKVLLEDIQKIVNQIGIPFAMRIQPEGEERRPYTMEFRPQLEESKKR